MNLIKLRRILLYFVFVCVRAQEFTRMSFMRASDKKNVAKHNKSPQPTHLHCYRPLRLLLLLLSLILDSLLAILWLELSLRSLLKLKFYDAIEIIQPFFTAKVKESEHAPAHCCPSSSSSSSSSSCYFFYHL